MSPSWAKCLRLIACVYFAICGVAAHPTERALIPLTPSIDPFYQPPAGFESEAPGAILRNRTIIPAGLGLIPAANVKAYQILFRTTAINGSAIAAVTTVFIPINAQLDKFISFHTAYDGSATVCDPSYEYQLLSSQQDAIIDFEFLLVEAYLLSGYIVSSPDYEGPQAAFGAGRLAGMVVLDSMRAVSNFRDIRFTVEHPAIVGTGYSGGAIATGWAASLQQTYAPDLPIQGWAQGGTPANLTGTAVFLDNTLFSGFLPPAIVGLNTETAYAAELDATLNALVTPYGESKLDFAKQNCIADLFNFAEMSVLSTDFQKLGDRLFYDPQVAGVMEQNVMGITKNITPVAPVYIFHAIPDEIIPYANASTLVNDWCGYGANVDFVTYANGGHLTTEVLGFPGAYKFVQSAFAGTTTTGCTRSTSLANTLDPVALGAELEPILVQLINALAKYGQEDSNVKANLNILKQPLTS